MITAAKINKIGRGSSFCVVFLLEVLFVV